MTEQEAATKWCPFARMTGNKGPFNRTADANGNLMPEPGARCIGNACMAWVREEHSTDGYCGMVR